MTNREAIDYAREQLEIFGGEHRAFIEKAIEALEKTEHKCENCEHSRSIDIDAYWCNERWMYVDDDMHCTDWSEE